MPDQQPTPSLAEYRRMAAEDDNTFWRLEGGDHLNLLDEAIEENDQITAEVHDERQLREAYQQAAEIGVETIKGLRADNARLDRINRIGAEMAMRERGIPDQQDYQETIDELEQVKSDRDQLAAELAETRSEGSRLYRSLQETARRVEDDRDALAAKLDAMPEPHEEWAIRVVKTLGGSGWYHHESSAETAEADRAQVLEILAESRDLAGQPFEHGPVSIVKRTVWASGWETVPGGPRPAAEVHAPGSTAETGSTGVPEPENSAQASDWPDVDGWTLHTRPGWLMVAHDTDADMPILRAQGRMPVGAVLAFIADQEEDQANG